MRPWLRAAGLAVAALALTAQSNNPPAGGGGSGTVTDITCGAGLSGGTITTSGTCLVPGGGITNAMLANSSLTIAGHSVSLGGTQALVCADLTDALGGCTANISLYATLASPTFTGTPAAPSAAAGTNTTQIASTAYVTTAVNNAIAGVNPAVAVQAATTAASDTSGLTYLNGVAGIGATFTGAVNTALTVDGFTFTALGQRLLVKNDTQAPSGAFNGVYYVTQLQSGILPPILTRALDYDMPSDINNTGAIPVINGTANGTTSWVITSTVNTVGTDPLSFTKFSINPATLAAIATSGSASDLSTGTVAPARLPVLAGTCSAELDCDNSGTRCGATGTTLTNITGMTVSLLAGKTYLVHGELYTSSGASGGVKIALANNDTLTVTSFALGATPIGTGVGGTNTTSLGTGIGATSALNNVPFDATVVVNVAGTLVVQGAQNATNAVQTKFLVNSYIEATQIN